MLAVGLEVGSVLLALWVLVKFNLVGSASLMYLCAESADNFLKAQRPGSSKGHHFNNAVFVREREEVLIF